MPPKSPIDSQEPTPKQIRRILRPSLKIRVLAIIAILFAFAVWFSSQTANLIQIMGAPWPTEPVFSPGPPSFGDAFGIPFTVENKSAFFWLRNIKIKCVIHSAAFIGPFGGASIDDVDVEAAGLPGSLAPVGSSATSSGVYFCPLRGIVSIGGQDIVEQAKSAQLSFESEYDKRTPWSARVTSEDGPFTLITTTQPPHWAKGIILK